jgi:hypothetical protein
LSFDGDLQRDASGRWDQKGEVHTLSGSGPTIAITVKLGAGKLDSQTE